MRIPTIQKILIAWLLVLASLISLQLYVGNVDPASRIAPIAQGASAVPTVLGSHVTALRGSDSKHVGMPIARGPLDTSGITARSFLVYESQTGQVLAEKNSTEQLSIASLTKLMTAMVAYERVGLTGSVEVGSEDVLSVNPVLHVEPGDRLSVLDIFSGMLVGSANDGALTLSNYVSRATGRDFVDLMNEKAEQLGMTDSHFSNPYGFDSKNNYATAQDLKKLVMETQKFSAFTNLGRLQQYEFSNQDKTRSFLIFATNKLVESHSDIEAIKTGYTLGTQGAMIVKVNHSGHSFVIIVLGSKNREMDTLELKGLITEGYIWP